MELSNEDAVFDQFWRKVFDQPLPLIGAGPVVRSILKKEGVTDQQIDQAIKREKKPLKGL
nr:hypothetical protein [uncultured Brevundimonas sp.]